MGFVVAVVATEAVLWPLDLVLAQVLPAIWFVRAPES